MLARQACSCDEGGCVGRKLANVVYDTYAMGVSEPSDMFWAGGAPTSMRLGRRRSVLDGPGALFFSGEGAWWPFTPFASGATFCAAFASEPPFVPFVLLRTFGAMLTSVLVVSSSAFPADGSSDTVQHILFGSQLKEAEVEGARTDVQSHSGAPQDPDVDLLPYYCNTYLREKCRFHVGRVQFLYSQR